MKYGMSRLTAVEMPSAKIANKSNNTSGRRNRHNFPTIAKDDRMAL
jgi:hypothetical protein